MAGIEPASRRLTGARLYQHRPHRKKSVRVAGFEPAFSCARGRRNPRLSHTLISRKHPARVELALPPWQGSRLPLHHGCKESDRIVKDREHRTHANASVPGLEPTSPPTNLSVGARTSACVSVGPEGLEPSPTWLRTRHAAANTLVPRFCLFAHAVLGAVTPWARRESNPRPLRSTAGRLHPR